MRAKLMVKRIAVVDKDTRKGPEKTATAILTGGSGIVGFQLTISGRPDRVREILDNLGAYYVGGEVEMKLERGDGDVANENEEGSQ
jgi:hypothetical protein